MIKAILEWILKKIRVNTANWFDLVRDRDLESSLECSIKPPGSISQGVSSRFHKSRSYLQIRKVEKHNVCLRIGDNILIG